MSSSPEPTPAEDPKLPKHVLLAFRELKGTKEVLKKAIAESAVAEHRKVYLAAELELLQGAAFRLDVQLQSDHPGELLGHLHFTRIF